MTLGYAAENPTRAEIDRATGPTVLQFGTNWCGYCRAAERYINPVLAQAEGVEHVKVEDGKGYRLGRSFRVKLWPTLVFLNDGAEVARVVRPTSQDEVSQALAKLSSSAPEQSSSPRL